MKNFIIGIFIGIGSILPGISSGVFCVSFGIYENLVNSVMNFFKNIKKSTTFLFPIIVGIFTGIFFTSNLLKVFFFKFYIPTSFAFIGLILGSLPLIIHQAKISRVNIFHILCLMLTLSFSLYLLALEKVFQNNCNIHSNIYLIFSGFISSMGIVIPGISKTAILIILGIYQKYIEAISTLNISFLIPIGIGIAFGSLFFLKLIQILFKNFKSYTYFSIIGFVIGSIFLIYPGFKFNFQGLISICLFILCFLVSYKIR